jgi:Gpi18-like mannosyltransferase
MTQAAFVHVLALGCGIALLAVLAMTTFVALKPLWPERRRELLVLAGLLASIAIVKGFLLPLFPGFSADLGQFLLWGEVMTRMGPGHVYDPEFICKYMPAYLYARWTVVAVASQFYLGYGLSPAVVSTLGVFSRIPPLTADFVVGLVIFAWLGILGGKRRGPGAVMLFALNPALLYTSVVWGQNDSVLTLPVMLAVLMASQANYGLAAAVAALAVLIKLQGLFVIPILGFWMLLHGRARDWIVAVLAFSAMVIIAFAPFQIGRPWYFIAGVVSSSLEYYPFTSLNAFNLMALVVGMRIPDSTRLMGVSAFALGLLLLSALYLIALFIVWRARSARMLLYATFLAYLGFFMLPTRIHERYLYFALALLTPLALDSWASITMFATLTVTLLTNLIMTLRYLDRLASLPKHDPFARAIACVNLLMLATATTYGLFIVSRDQSRWPGVLRAFFKASSQEA